MFFTNSDRERAERIEKALNQLWVDVGYRDRTLGGGYGPSLSDVVRDVACKLNYANSKFDKLQGFVENRIKPLDDNEKFEWAKSILFSRGYVVVMIEDFEEAKGARAKEYMEEINRLRKHIGILEGESLENFIRRREQSLAK